MNDYVRLVAHAAAKYTGQPAVLSPMLDSVCGMENKKSRLSSEPVRNDTRIILSTSGLAIEELKVEYNDCLKVYMKHAGKDLGENNFKWSRDCAYKYVVNPELVPFLSAYWTCDEFLVIQARDIESYFDKETGVKDLQKYKLIPIDLVNILEPALNAPFLKQILKSIKKKSTEIASYVSKATEVPESRDVLSLLTCVPLKQEKKFDFENLRLDAELSSQEEGSGVDKSQSDSEDQSPKKKSNLVKTKSKSDRGSSKHRQSKK